MPNSNLQLAVGLQPLDYAAIAGYLALTFGIALWFGRRQKNVDDFFVGGRHMPWFAVGLSILATLFSTLSYLGTPGEMIKNGLGVFTGFLAVPFSMVVVLYLWIPFFMRLKLTSAYEYLELRFNYRVRLAGAVLFVLLRLGWMSMVVFAASLALDKIKGPDLEWLPGPDIYWWMSAIGLVAAVYTAVGGIQAMIWTDVLQCFLLLGGVLLTIGLVVAADGSGPIEWWNAAAKAEGRENVPPIFSVDLTVRVTLVFAFVNNFFWTICTHGSDQVVLQRYFSTASLRSARRGYLINFVVDLTMASLLALCGLALLAYYLNHPDRTPEGIAAVAGADKLFPHFLGTQLPAGLTGLIVSAFLCDAIQTLESGANAITAVVSNDVVPRIRHGRPRIMSDLTFVRLLSFAVAIIVTVNAFFVAMRYESIGETIIGMMPKFFNMFVGPLAGMFAIGMFVPRATARSVLPAAACGVSVSIGWSWGPELASLVGWEWPRLTFLLAIAVPWLTTVGMGWTLSRLIEPSRRHPGLNYTWRSVVKGTGEPLQRPN